MNPIAPFQSLLLRGLVVALAALASLFRHQREAGAALTASEPALPREPWLAFLRAAAEPDPVRAAPATRRPARRVAVSAAFAALFCLGAAFTAAAGDLSVGLLEDTTTPAAETTTTDDAATTPAAATTTTDDAATPGETATPSPAETTTDETDAEPARPAPPPAPESPPAETPASPPAETAAPTPAADEDATVLHHTAGAAVAAPAVAAPVAAPVHRRAAPKRPAPLRKPAAPALLQPLKLHEHSTALELDGRPIGATTVWLHRILPDPTPPARRLTADFAQQLGASSRFERVDWTLVLGVLRARGETGAVPASQAELDALAQELARAGAREQPSTAVLAVTGDTATADTALALANLYRALGRAALVHGLEWAKESLGRRLLHDRRVTIYAGGQADIEAGRVDVRVLALIAYLTEEFGSIDVSCLISGHRLFARPGVVSAHIYGQAVDIAALGDTTILGHQEPGGITERAVRSILLLPPELRPRQVISLLGLGGPSFPQADHDDHIHAGF